MKKIKYLLFTLLLTIFLIPNVYAKDNVEIKSITLDSKSENTIVNKEPIHNGLLMDFDLSFKQKNDYAKYKVIIKNDTNIEYKISNDTAFNKSDHITYTYDVEGTLKPKGETIVYVTITYSKEVNESELIDGKYQESNKAVIQLLNKDGEVVNPNTGISIILLISTILLIVLFSTLLIKNKKKVLLPIIITLLLIPTLVYGAETLRLTINVKVDILKGYKVKYVVDYEGYFKSNELKQYDMSSAQCNKTYYIGDITEENKYTYCRNLMETKDNTLYNPGARIELKNIMLRQFTLEYYENNTWKKYCEEQSEDIFLCSENIPITNKTVSYWDYSIGPRTYNPLGLNSDKVTMNFSSIFIDDWETYKSLYIKAPATFTMPNHDVTFFVDNYGSA